MSKLTEEQTNSEEYKKDVEHLFEILEEYKSDCKFRIVPVEHEGSHAFVVLHNVTKKDELVKLEVYLKVKLEIENVSFQFSEFI